MKGFSLENAAGIAREIIPELSLEEEETAIDPVRLRLGFLRKVENATSTVDGEFAEARARVDTEHRADETLFFMEREFRIERDIAHAVPVGDREGFARVVLHRIERSSDPPAGHAVEAGIDHANTPVFLLRARTEGLRRGVRLTTMIDFEVGFSEAVVEE